MRIVQISDTHLTHLGGVTNKNFETLVAFVNDVLKPDLVVNTGDIAILSPDSSEDREAARALHEAFTMPVRVVPGNHDVGEPGAQPWAGIGVSSDRVSGFRSAFGTDHWVEIVHGAASAEEWAVVGINSELLTSGLPEEAEQWDFLAGVAEGIGARPTLLFLHKPLWSPMEVVTEHALTIPKASRQRLLELLAPTQLLAIGSGHLHRYWNGQRDGIATVFAPSTAFVVRASEMGMSFGLDQLGVVEYVCENGIVTPNFRSVPTLDEGEPWHLPEFAVAWNAIGAGPLPSLV